MSSTGTCDTDSDYSRTQPVLASGGSPGSNGNGGPTTLSTVISSAAPQASARAGGNGVGSGSCKWKGHCQGAYCWGDDDCGDPLSCINNVCTAST